VKVHILKILAFIVAILAGTIVVFPGRQALVSYFIKTGEGQEARKILQELQKKKPEDPALFLLSAETYQTEGRPDLSIEELKKALKLAPNNLTLLVKLAEYYELNRQPDEALVAWEKVQKIQSNHSKALVRLIELYRYRGETAKEARMAAHLLSMESQAPKKPYKHSPLADMMTETLHTISIRRGASSNDDLRAAAIAGLSAERMMYIGDLESGVDDREARQSIVADCLEYLSEGGFSDEGIRFAQKADERLGLGVESRRKMSELLRYSGKQTQALALLQQVTAVQPGNLWAWQQKAEILLEQGQQLEALAAMEKILLLNPKEKSIRERMAEIHVALGNLPKAFHHYKELETFPQKSLSSVREKAALRQLLAAAEATGNKEIITMAAGFALDLYPRDMEVMAASAKLYLAADRLADAYPLFFKVASAGRTRENVLKMLEVARFTGRADFMVQAAGLAQKTYFADPEIGPATAEILAGHNRLPEAAAAYSAYLRKNQRDTKVLFRLTEIYEWMNHPSAAYLLLKPLADQNRLDKSLLIRAARLAEAAGKNTEAFSIVQRLSRTYPREGRFKADMARLAAWSNQPQIAAGILAEISDEDRESYEKALAAGNAFVEADQTKKALPYLERAIALRPDNVDLRRSLVKYYGWTGLRRKQVENLFALEKKGALQKQEKIMLAEVYLQRRQGSQALELLEHVEKERALPYREGMMLTQAYFLSGQEAAADRIFRRLAGENARNSRLLAELGNQALGLKRTDIALEFYESALRIHPKNTAALKRSAQIYAWNNDARRAMKRFEDHNRIQADDVEARFQLGELYFSSDQKGQAFGEYKKALELIRQARKAQKNQARQPGMAKE